jgi:hypothetical protein
MNYKITSHFMPWELDYALLSFTQLKKSKYYVNDEDTIYIDATLNLSDYLIDWNETKIPKDFFIDKFISLQPLLKDYKCRFKIYDGDKLYGGLNTTFESTEDHIDHYIIMNSDMYFSEHLLAYLIEGSKSIKNEYFIITPQVAKLWDNTWDPITHPNYLNIDYKNWKDIDTYDVRYFLKNIEEEISIVPMDLPHKWAGWFDLYNKKMWDEFYAIDGWDGYGGHDYYTMLLSQFAKQSGGLDIQQYILKNAIVCEYESGPLKEGNFSKYYKDRIIRTKGRVNQRALFDSKMPEYIEEGIKKLKDKNLIPQELFGKLQS